MKSGDSTQLLAALGWRDARAHLLDDTWLLTIFGLLFATAVPWLVSGLRIDLLPAVAGLVALGAIHVAFAALADRHSARSAARKRTLAALHALGVIAVAYVWVHAGGLHNPLFLLVFALPIVGSIFLSRWQPYLVAALVAALVALVAVSEVPELRWYAPPALVDVLSYLDGIVGRGGAELPFAGFYAPSEYFVVLLEVFVILLLACAVAAEYLGTIFERLSAQVAAGRAAAERGQQLWTALIEALPLPAFLLDAHTCEVICASAAGLAGYGGGASADHAEEAPAARELAGRNFFEALSFSYPEVVQELVSGTGGVAPLCMMRRGGRLRTAEVRVRHLAQHGRRLALVIVSDTTEAFCMKSALDVSESATLVADARGRVLAFNKPAAALFPGARLDVELSGLLPPADPEARWWDPGLTGRRKLHVAIMQRVYQLTSSTVVLPGEDERVYVVAFLPVAHAAEADQSTTSLSSRLQRP
jgi:PAS domain-containing protein